MLNYASGFSCSLKGLQYEINTPINSIYRSKSFTKKLRYKVFAKNNNYFTVLYCTVLYCTVLYCTVLYCTVLYCTVLYCTVLYCTVLYCTVQYCTVLYCTVLYSTALHCTALHCTVLDCTALYYKCTAGTMKDNEQEFSVLYLHAFHREFHYWLMNQFQESGRNLRTEK